MIFRISVLISVLLTMATMSTTLAQPYERGIGVRGGMPMNGITYKQSIGGNNALEGILGFRHRGFQITGLYQRYQGAFDVDNLFWFYGAGGHVGIYESRRTPFYDDDRTQRLIAGVDGILGIEYQIQEIPFAISLDYKPYVAFSRGPYADFIVFAISVRYTW